MKSMSKYELAEAAGVSAATFRRWLKTDRAFLEANGITPKTKILPPNVVQYLCDKYCIDIE
jgi:DeoR/GlpR family transcriptional regulator of sugar metabolism